MCERATNLEKKGLANKRLENEESEYNELKVDRNSKISLSALWLLLCFTILLSNANEPSLVRSCFSRTHSLILSTLWCSIWAAARSTKPLFATCPKSSSLRMLKDRPGSREGATKKKFLFPESSLMNWGRLAEERLKGVKIKNDSPCGYSKGEIAKLGEKSLDVHLCMCDDLIGINTLAYRYSLPSPLSLSSYLIFSFHSFLKQTLCLWVSWLFSLFMMSRLPSSFHFSFSCSVSLPVSITASFIIVNLLYTIFSHTIYISQRCSGSITLQVVFLSFLIPPFSSLACLTFCSYLDAIFCFPKSQIVISFFSLHLI